MADEVSESFSEAPNALALDAIARNIERSRLELFNRQIPEEKLPDRQYQLTEGGWRCRRWPVWSHRGR